MHTITLGQVRYNARDLAFEARVDVTRNGATYRYPCQVPGPADIDPVLVAATLVRQAVQMSDTGHRA